MAKEEQPRKDIVDTEPNGEMKLEELAERSGVPARTIRLYITQGLLDGPLRAGRNAAYGPGHLGRLAAIREFQRDGLTLSQIRRRLAEPGESGPRLPDPAPVWAYEVAPDVTVMVRGDTPPWRLRTVHRALAELQKALEETEVSREDALTGGTDNDSSE
jgi:DNA-binding transcriptional MerR regulator